MKSLQAVRKLLGSSKGVAYIFAREINVNFGRTTHSRIAFALRQLDLKDRNTIRVIDILNHVNLKSSVSTTGCKKVYGTIDEVFANHLLRDEDPNAMALMDKLSTIRQRGEFTREEFLEMCYWKSARPLQHYRNNSEERVKEISGKVFAEKDELKKILFLDSLKGVSVPVASAILTLTDPENYGVIDIRVWQVLYVYGVVNFSPTGKGLSTRHWIEFLTKARKWAAQLGVSTRCVERTIFEHHKATQQGTLY